MPTEVNLSPLSSLLWTSVSVRTTVPAASYWRTETGLLSNAAVSTFDHHEIANEPEEFIPAAAYLTSNPPSVFTFVALPCAAPAALNRWNRIWLLLLWRQMTTKLPT